MNRLVKIKPSLTASLILTVVISAGVIAEPSVQLRGFGTLGLAHNDDDADYLRYLSQPDGVKDSFDGDLDSRLGLQLDANFTEELQGILQVVSSYNYKGNYDPEITWALLQYSPDANWKLRGGRIGWDIYLGSDSRDVGFSYLWARPPQEYYGTLQFTKIDGADVQYTWPVGNALVSAKVYAGVAGDIIPVLGSKQIHADLGDTKLWGINLDTTLTDWQFRLAVGRIQVDIETKGDLENLHPLIAAALRTSDELLAGSITDFITVGAIYERGAIRGQIMANRLSKTDLVASQWSGFTTLGYRIGEFTPYISYAFTDVDDEIDTTGLTPIELGITIQSRRQQHTVSAGVRYDFHPQAALKFQVDRVNVREGGRASALWPDNEPDWDGRVTVVSATLDFIF